MNHKTRLFAYRFSYVIAFTCLSASLFASRVEAETWELKFVFTQENLCAFNGQTAGIPLSVDPGDEVIVQVKNNTLAKHFLHWQGAMYYGGSKSTAATQAVSRRFYSLQRPMEAGETFNYRWKIGSQGTLIHGCRLL
jgi:FtsP/CotA-like multicopper oxidase with cupredoxin domain